MPLTDVDVRNQRCIDWGVRPVVRWTHPLAAVARTQQVSPDPGYLVLIGDQPVLTSYYSSGAGDRQYWNLRTGEFLAPGESDFCIIAAWSLGASSADGKFVPLATYPDHYGPG